MIQYCSGILQIASEHSLSDRALKKFHCLIALRISASNNLPSFSSIQTYQSVWTNSESKTVCSNWVCLSLNLKPLLSKIIKDNLHILDQCKNWIPEKIFELPSIFNEFLKTIQLIINTNWVSRTKLCKYQLYPVWLQVANLPCSIRSQHKSHILAALFGVVGKPNGNVSLSSSNWLKKDSRWLWIREPFSLLFSFICFSLFNKLNCFCYV